MSRTFSLFRIKIKDKETKIKAEGTFTNANTDGSSDKQDECKQKGPTTLTKVFFLKKRGPRVQAKAEANQPQEMDSMAAG